MQCINYQFIFTKNTEAVEKRRPMTVKVNFCIAPVIISEKLLRFVPHE